MGKAVRDEKVKNVLPHLQPSAALLTWKEGGLRQGTAHPANKDKISLGFSNPKATSTRLKGDEGWAGVGVGACRNCQQLWAPGLLCRADFSSEEEQGACTMQGRGWPRPQPPVS